MYTILCVLYNTYFTLQGCFFCIYYDGNIVCVCVCVAILIFQLIIYLEVDNIVSIFIKEIYFLKLKKTFFSVRRVHFY